MKMGKRIAALLLALTMTLALLPALRAPAFAQETQVDEAYDYNAFNDPLGLFHHEDGRTYASREIAELAACYGEGTDGYFIALARTGIITLVVEVNQKIRLMAGSDYPHGRNTLDYIHRNPANNLYEDVKEDAWYYEAVKAVTFGGLVYGDQMGTFRPNDYLTSAELARVICQIYGYSSEVINAAEDRKPIEALVIANLGFASCTVERKNDKVTRGEAIEALLVVVRAIGRERVRELTWDDVEDAQACKTRPSGHEWAPSAILDALNWGVIDGVNAAHRVNPAAPLTRAELCKILANIGVMKSGIIESYKAFPIYQEYKAAR